MSTRLPRGGPKRIAAWMICGIRAALLIASPFASIPLSDTEPLVAAFATAILASDLITFVMLYSPFSIQRSAAVLVLATGYLFAALTAADLQLSEVTVKAHRAQVMQKMRARSLPDLVRVADLLGGSRNEAHFAGHRRGMPQA